MGNLIMLRPILSEEFRDLDRNDAVLERSKERVATQDFLSAIDSISHAAEVYSRDWSWR